MKNCAALYTIAPQVRLKSLQTVLKKPTYMWIPTSRLYINKRNNDCWSYSSATDSVRYLLLLKRQSSLRRNNVCLNTRRLPSNSSSRTVLPYDRLRFANKDDLKFACCKLIGDYSQTAPQNPGWWFLMGAWQHLVNANSAAVYKDNWFALTALLLLKDANMRI